MKDAEDEAFDELAKRQGDWGGGFMAKKAMAADKLQEPDEALTLEALKYAASKGYGRIVRENSAPFTIKQALAQPAQEPVTEREALKLAEIIEHFDSNDESLPLELLKEIAATLRALAQPAQEPVAWTTMPEAEDWCFVSGNKDPNGKLEGKWFPLYTTPPQRPWVGLTDEEIKEIIGSWGDTPVKGYTRKLFDQIEAKLKEKNT